MNPTQLITSAGISFATAFAASSFKGAEGPAQALDDVMTLVGFDSLNLWAEKKRVRKNQDIQNYKKEIAQKIMEVSEDDLQDPELSIVGPALEASKYYIEEEELRRMFAKLIAAAMDKTKSDMTHPSYVEIIKQLTPLDAQNLKSIYDSSSEVPIAKIFLYFENGAYIEHLTQMYLGNPYEKQQSLISPSIDNLGRLALINIDYNSVKANDESYDIFYESLEYKNASEIQFSSKLLKNVHNESENVHKTIDSLKQKYEHVYQLEEYKLLIEKVKELKHNLDRRPVFDKIELKKGVAKITPFGKNFYKTCL